MLRMKLIPAALCSIGALTVALPAHADQLSDLQAQLQKLSAEVQQLKAQQAQAAKQAAATQKNGRCEGSEHGAGLESE